jgi:putative ABC transport system permease protein
LVLFELLRPYFSDMLGRPLLSVLQFKADFFLVLLGFIFLIGLMAGFYPAFILSSYKSIESLKGKLISIKNGVLFTRSLVVSQFSLAIFVFIATIVISSQVAYFLSKELGYDKSYVLTVSSVPRIWTEEGVKKMETARTELMKLPQITESALSWEIPNGNFGRMENIYPEGKTETESIAMPILGTDENYAKTYKLNVSEGAFFHEKGGSWQRYRMVINEAAVKALGWKTAVGKKVKMSSMDTSFTVVGVVKDFNFSSLHEQVKPMGFLHIKNTSDFRYFSFRLNPGNMEGSIKAVEAKWNEIFPGAPFDYAFMDKNLSEMYKSEIQLKKASNIATVLSLIIVLLGVLGLVSLTVSKRTKEIGIRKVLGASMIQVIMLFLKEFLILMVIANLLAWPLVYYVMQDWLGNFAYKIELGPGSFLLVSVFVGLLTSLLVSLQSIRTASINPVKSLRYE